MNRELLMLVDAISREKSVDRDVVFGAVESALRDVRTPDIGGTAGTADVGRALDQIVRGN